MSTGLLQTLENATTTSVINLQLLKLILLEYSGLKTANIRFTQMKFPTSAPNAPVIDVLH